MPAIDVTKNTEYMNLITSEYADKPLFNQYVEAFLNSAQPIAQCLDSFKTIFNIDNAVGDQLDKLGEIVALTRELPIDDPDVPSVLPDDLFREVIKARIRSNFWDGTMQGLEQLVEATFPDSTYQIIDGQDMTMQVTMINPSASLALIGLLFNGYILPKPAGVDTHFTVIDKPLFGWDSDTSFVKGWDLATWNDN